MNEFINKLENKLMILEEAERNKIIKKYQKEIEKNVKDGMSESEAIESLGDFDSIVDKVYAEYHINDKYKKDNKSLGQKFNDFISSSAEFLTEFCQDLITYAKNNTKDKPLETFFEILLKILLLVMAFMIIKIPFIILEEFFAWIFGLLFYPFNYVLSGIATFILAIIYFVCCVLLGIATFKNYYGNSPKKEDKKRKKETVVTSEQEEDKNVVYKTYTNYAFIILKVFLYIVIIIPLIFLNIAFLVLAAFAGFLVFKGVNLVGLAILLIGLFLIILTVTNYITDALDNKPKNHTFALIISVISLIVGVILFTDSLFKFNYPKTLEDSWFRATNETTLLTVDKKTDITAVDGNINMKIDNSLIDNEILLEVTYYDELVDIIIERYEGKEKNYILIYTADNDISFGTFKYLYESTIKDLKDDNIFNYKDLKRFEVNVFCNETTKELLK